MQLMSRKIRCLSQEAKVSVTKDWHGSIFSYRNSDPVEVEISPDGGRIDVSPVSEDYLQMSKHPAYKSSSLVQNAAAASRLIVTTSTQLSNMLTSGADSFTQKTKPLNKPMSFTPAAHDRARKINKLSQGAAGISAKTVGQATKYAQNLGASMTRGGRSSMKPGSTPTTDRSGKPHHGHKPGFLNKSMIAFSTIADGIEESGKRLLNSGGVAATTVVGHRYGTDARQIASEVAGGVKNVGLVYIDVAGVSRKAVLKSVAKGMVVGKVKGGGEVIVGGGDGGVVTVQNQNQQPGSMMTTSTSSSSLNTAGAPVPGMAMAGMAPTGNNVTAGGGGGMGGSDAQPAPQGQLMPDGGMYGVPVVGFGNAAAPSYDTSGVGEPLGSQTMSGEQKFY